MCLLYRMIGLGLLACSATAMVARRRDGGVELYDPNWPIYGVLWVREAHHNLVTHAGKMEAARAWWPIERTTVEARTNSAVAFRIDL